MLHGFTRRHTKLTIAVLLGLAACGFVCFRGSFAARETTLDASPQPKSIAEDRVRLLIGQAAQLRTAGHYTQAAPLLDEALALAESSSGPDSVTTATVLNQLGMLDKYTGRFDEGDRVYRRALKIVEQKLGPLDPLRADLYHNLGGINHARGRYAEGEPFARLSVEIRERSLGPDYPDTAADIAALAALMDGQGQYEEAEQLYLRSLAVFERVYGSENFDVAVNLNNLAALYYARGNIKEAELRYRQALAIKEKLLGPDHPDVAITLNNLAVFCKAQQRYSEAASLYRRALPIFERELGHAHPQVKTCRANYEKLLREMGQRCQRSSRQISSPNLCFYGGSRFRRQEEWIIVGHPKPKPPEKPTPINGELAATSSEYWRPVRESNPCRRREREVTYCNSTELSGMDSLYCT